MKRITLAAAPVGLVVVLLSACGASHASAPDPGNNIDGATPGTRAHVIQEPYGFRNVAFACYGRVGVYVTSHGVTATSEPSSVAAVPNDPNCA